MLELEKDPAVPLLQKRRKPLSRDKLEVTVGNQENN
jgi:hypothetical protein